MIRVTAMNRKRFVGDWAMLGTVFGLILFGLLMIYSASNYTARLHMGNAFYYVERQIFTVLLGTAAMFLMMKLDYHRLLKMALPLYGLSLLLLAAVFVVGTASHGQKRWIYIGSIGFQPSEFAKFVLIIFLASICGAAGSMMKKWKWHTARVFMDDAGGGNGHGDKSQHGNYHYGNCLHYHFYSQQAMAAVFCADGIRWWIHGDIFEACLIPGRKVSRHG